MVNNPRRLSVFVLVSRSHIGIDWLWLRHFLFILTCVVVVFMEYRACNVLFLFQLGQQQNHKCQRPCLNPDQPGRGKYHHKSRLEIFKTLKSILGAYSFWTVHPCIQVLILSGAYLLYYMRQESQIWCVDTPWGPKVLHTIFGDLDLASILEKLCPEHISKTIWGQDPKGVLAIKRIFSLVDMITNTKYSNCPNDFKIKENPWVNIHENTVNIQLVNE